VQTFLSVIVPLYNEEPVIHELYDRLTTALRAYDEKYEIIFINDGSRDKTKLLAKEICLRDKNVKLINFSRNFGHQVAITAGMDRASGQVIVTIDADLQDPPEIIPEMVKVWEEGYQVVHGVRKKRKGENVFRLATIFLFYRFLRKITSVDMTMDSGDFRLMDRKVVEELKRMREKNRYIRGMVSWVGFRQTEVEYVRQKRYAGETKYPFRKLVKLAADGILSFSQFPLKISLAIGYFCSLVSLFFILYGLISQYASGKPSLSGWMFGILILLFLGGIQLITIGFLGQYIGRICEQTNERPIYVTEEEINFD
jgi:glycosyltransferase involved in cell wall biosynthesis